MTSIRTILFLAAASASALAAQGPGAPPAPMNSGPGPAAKLLLANTGELELTDAQVVRLAAIARRSEARRRSARATMDSARARFDRPAPGDSTARRQFRDRMRADMDRAREQGRADQRDAIAVLTPDQQARAWELVSARGRGFGGGMRGGRMGRGMRGGMGGGRGIGMMRRREGDARQPRPGFHGPDGRPQAPPPSRPPTE